MSDLTEILLSSDSSGTSWTCCAWDPRSGTQLLTYKGGGPAGLHALTFIRNEFIISANSAKPTLHIWPINSQEQIQGIRLVTPGRVQALAVSPDGCFCVAAVAEHIYIWQICSGRLLAALSRHYQPVTTIRFLDDGSHFVSAAQDGMVLVWRLSDVISVNSTNQTLAPLYSFADHALPVSDVFVGKGGIRAYLISVSLDSTCKIYDLSSGNLLLNLVFPEALTAVIVDHLETKVFVGSIGGCIYEFSLQSPPRTKEYHLTSDEANNKFVGHKSAVTTLSLSLDNETLASGSKDETIILWHTPSKQVIRTIAHKGSITNVQFSLAPKAMFNQDQTLNLIINNFKRMIDPNDEDHVVEVLVTEKEYEEADTMDIGEVTNRHFGANANAGVGSSSSSSIDGQRTGELESLRIEMQKLRNINRELFDRSLKSILSTFNSDVNNHVCNV